MFGEYKKDTNFKEPNSSRSDFHKIIMKAIAVLTLVALALPILSMIGILGSVNLALFQGFGSRQNLDPIEEQLKSANRNNGINSGDSIAYLKSIYEKLDSNASTKEEARLATHLNIIFADFDSNVEPIDKDSNFMQLATSSQQTLLQVNKATRLINLDFKRMGDAAFVVISNRPMLLNIVNQPKNLFGRLGVENKLPFDITNFEGPFLAGFRVEAFNFYKAIDPSNLLDQEKKKRRNSKLCSAIKDWQKFFDVKNNNIKIWRAINPLRLELQESVVKSPDVKPVRSKNFRRLCIKSAW